VGDSCELLASSDAAAHPSLAVRAECVTFQPVRPSGGWCIDKFAVVALLSIYTVVLVPHVRTVKRV